MPPPTICMCLFLQGGDWGDDGVLLFEPHTRAVGCMAFSRANASHLLTLSYDGSLRCMDIEMANFDDVRQIFLYEMFMFEIKCCEVN